MLFAYGAHITAVFFPLFEAEKNHIPSDNSFGFDCTYTLTRWIASAFKQPKPFFFRQGNCFTLPNV